MLVHFPIATIPFAFIVPVALLAGWGVPEPFIFLIEMITDFDEAFVGAGGEPLSVWLGLLGVALVVVPNVLTLFFVRSIFRYWRRWDIFGVGPVGTLLLPGVAFVAGFAACIATHIYY